MGLVHVIVFLWAAVFLAVSFPAPETVKDEEKSTILKPSVDLPDNEAKILKISENDGEHHRVARAANPQVGHFVNYIRDDDRFPTLA